MTMIPPPGPPGPPDEPPQDGGGTATEPIPNGGVHPHDGLPAPDIVGAVGFCRKVAFSSVLASVSH